MAKMHISGILDFDGFGDLSGEEIDEAMRIGSEVFVDAWKRVIEEKGHVRTGAMRDSVAPTKIVHMGAGAFTEIYPQGKDSKHVRNAMKAYVINYGKRYVGRSRRARKRRLSPKDGDFFIDVIDAIAEDEAVAAMTDYIMEIQQRGSR